MSKKTKPRRGNPASKAPAGRARADTAPAGQAPSASERTEADAIVERVMSGLWAGIAAGEGESHTVAVKVLRPDIRRRFKRDLDTFYEGARLAERFDPEARRLRPIAVVDTLARGVTIEMDLRLEAAALSELAENTRDDPGFRVPKVEWELTARDVLTLELAMNERVRVRVLSSFKDELGGEGEGTLVVDEDEIVEKENVSGIAYSRDEAKITVRRVPDRPGIAASIFGALNDQNVNVDMIVQNISADGTTDMTFTVGKADLPRARAALADVKPQIGYAELLEDPDVAKISVVGVGMRSHAGVANTMFRALADKAINIQVISTSEIKVSVLIAAEYTELAVRALHTAYGLDAS